MMRALVLCTLAMVTLAPACPTPPLPQPAVIVVTERDAGADAGLDACGNACANLRALLCPEAADLFLCVDRCRAAHGTLTDLAPECVAKAATKSEVTQCSPAWKHGCGQ